MFDWVVIMRHIQIITQNDNDCVDTNRTRVRLGHEYKTQTSRAKKNDWVLIRVHLLGLLGHDNNTHINSR
jgi:hypothetical protein